MHPASLQLCFTVMAHPEKQGCFLAQVLTAGCTIKAGSPLLEGQIVTYKIIPRPVRGEKICEKQ